MIISLNDFNDLSEKDKKKTLANLKQEVGVSGISNAWNISRSKAYSMMREYDISVNTKTSRLSRPKKIDESQNTKNNTVSSKSTNNSTNSNSKYKKPNRTTDKQIPSELTMVASNNESDKFHLYLETRGSAPMINETIRMLLESGKLTDSNLQINMTLQEI